MNRKDPQTELLEALRRGDRKTVIAILMREYNGPLYGYCCMLMRDKEVARDVVANVFCRIYEKLDSLEDFTKIRSWIFSIAHNLCMKERGRAARERQHIELSDALPDLPADAAVGIDRLKALRDCVEELPEHIRYPLLLRYFTSDEQLTFEELGEILRESPSTLHYRIASAIPVLRACLQRKEVAI
jgi:RNA polymerase sigma-70 factor (ECF subfamily)